MGLPKYIINVDELQSIISGGTNLQATVSTEELNKLLEDYLTKLIKLLDALLTGDKTHIQRSIGLHSYIPALAFDYELVHIFDKDVCISGITHSQTGWKVMDHWDLFIGETLLFESIFTKELGEYKHFNVLYPVTSGTEVKIVYHNTSSNSKQIWFDIDYLEVSLIGKGEPIKIIVKPKETVEIGYIEVPEGLEELTISMTFETISGAQFPDLEVSAPNGDTFGYTREHMTEGQPCSTAGLSSCEESTYSGWISNPEEMVFKKPMPGKWFFYGQSQAGVVETEAVFTCSQPVVVTYQ